MNLRTRMFAKDPSGTFASWAEGGVAPAATLVSVLIRAREANVDIEIGALDEDWGDIRDADGIEELKVLELMLRTGGTFHHFSSEAGSDLATLAQTLLEQLDLTDDERADLQHIIEVVNTP